MAKKKKRAKPTKSVSKKAPKSKPPTKPAKKKSSTKSKPSTKKAKQKPPMRSMTGGTPVPPVAAKKKKATTKKATKPKAEAPAVVALDGTLATSRPCAAVVGTTLFVPERAKLRAFAYAPERATDLPSWKQDMPATIVAVAAAGEDIVAVDTSGNVRIAAAHGQVRHELTIADVPRSVCASASGRVAVLGARAVHLIEDGTAFEIGFAGPVAGTFTGDDELFVVGEGRRAARIGRGMTRAATAPEPMHALSAIGGRVHALGATGRWTYEAGDWLRTSSSIDTHVASSPGGTRLAFATPRSIEVVNASDNTAVKSCTWPDKFSRPVDSPLRVYGIAFRGEDRLLVAIGEGQANLLHLDTGSAEKIDPFAEETSMSWVFIYDGKILVAG